MEELSVTLLANAGILMEYGNKALLIDALYCKDGHFFSNPSEELITAVLGRAERPYNLVDTLLYTHDHPDHYSRRLTRQFLSETAGTTVIMPESAAKCDRMADENNLFSLNLGYGETEEIRSGDITVTCFRTLHIKEQYASVEHYSFLLRFRDKSVLVTGDSAPDLASFSCIRESVDVVIANPLFFGKKTGRDILLNRLKPKRLILYHIPFEGEDKTGVRDFARYISERLKVSFPAVDLLLYERQKIVL